MIVFEDRIEPGAFAGERHDEERIDAGAPEKVPDDTDSVKYIKLRSELLNTIGTERVAPIDEE